MANVHEFIFCPVCGQEFRSEARGNAVNIGGTETCPNPSCGASVNPPTLADGVNWTRIQPQLSQWIKDYGADGYIYTAISSISLELSSKSTVDAANTYLRNIERAITLIDVHGDVAATSKQVILASACISVITAYETLVDDALLVLQDAQLLERLEDDKRPRFERRVENLFKRIGLNMFDHARSMKYLYALRNCLTHRAGIVDEKLLKDLERIDGKIFVGLYTIGDPLALTALEVTSFADSCQLLAEAVLLKTDAALKGI